jgi:hypothetical protein
MQRSDCHLLHAWPYPRPQKFSSAWKFVFSHPYFRDNWMGLLSCQECPD